MNKIFILFLFFINYSIYSQKWVLKYNFSESNSGGGNLFETLNGDYLISVNGWNWSYESWAGFIKLDKKGNIIKEKKFNNSEFYSSLQLFLKTNENNFIFLGNKRNSLKIAALEMDENYNILWQKEYSFNLPDGYIKPVGIIQLDDGFLIMAYFWSSSSTPQSFYIIKIEKNGEIIWVKNCKDFLYKAVIFPNEIILLYGEDYNGDAVIVKINKNGIILEQNAYNVRIPDYYFPNGDDGIGKIIFKNNGNKIIIGGSLFFKMPSLGWIMEISADGKILWKSGYKSIGLELVSLEEDGSMIFKSDTIPFRDLPFMYIFKLSQKGDFLWGRYFDFEWVNYGTNIIKDGDYFVFSGTICVENCTDLFITKALIGKMDKKGQISDIEGCKTYPINFEKFEGFEIEEVKPNVSFIDYHFVTVSNLNLSIEDVKGESDICRAESKHKRPF